MPESPDSGNYTLGKGRILWMGRDLGNIPAFSMNVTIDKLKHYSSRSGLKSLDKTIITQVTPTCSFTIDEMSAENVNMSLLGNITKVVQAKEDISGSIASALGNTNYLCTNTADAARKFDIGVWKVPHGTVTGGPFVVGETITGGTSAATGEVLKVSANYLYVNTITGTDFEASEVLTGGTSSATATSSGAQLWTADLAVHETTTYYDLGTDYTVDAKSGRIKIVAGGGIADATAVSWEGSCRAKTYSAITGLANTSLSGPLTFIPDVPEGNNIELNFHAVDLTPSGDLSLIGEETMTVEFAGDILKDEVGHPESPYLDGFIDDFVI